MITKVEAIKKVLEEFDGVATWEQIYNNIEKHYPPAKVSKEWKAGIRGVLYREIRKERHFKKIGLGIYALKDYEEEQKPKVVQKQRVHPYIEGICLELGNFEGFNTYTADPSSVFKDKISLTNIATLKTIPSFTYPEILSEVKRIDVIWFNKRGLMFPQKVFEVVDSIGTLSDAFNRTLQLLNFRTDFLIVGPKEHQEKFSQKIILEPYIRFKERYRFKDYDTIIKFYEQSVKLNEVKTDFFI
jgi:hypothetical protein